VPRKAGSFASGEAYFFGTIGLTLPKDTRITSEDGVEYGTTVDTLFISGFEIIPIQAVEEGVSGNQDIIPVTIYQLVSPVSGFQDECNLYEDITGGLDQEEDEIYRKRILHRIHFPPMGGNAEDYITWSTEVDGVDQAWSYPLAFGPGTVAVVITAVGSPVASALLLDDVSVHLSEVKPIGATVIVLSVTDNSGAPGTAQIDYDISLNPNTTDFQEKIRENLEALYYPFKPGGIIYISQVRGAISATGVPDYEITYFAIDGVGSSLNDEPLNGFAYPTIERLIFNLKS
jgi:uncharacterized phage protein gp47/JayE